MKKLLLTLLICISISSARAQCVYTCSNYAVSQITYTTFPVGPTDITPSFTNSMNGTIPDDGSTGPISIGFNFDFYCNTYTAVHICSNGFITFDYGPFLWPTQYVHPTQSLPNSAFPNGMVALNMTDLDPGQGGSITYTTVGTAPNRMFIVTYSNVPCFSTTDLTNGQIVLYETSNIIEIHTGSARPDPNQNALGSFQGIENTTGSDFAVLPARNGNNTWGANADLTAYQFSPYAITPPGAISGSSIVCQGTQVLYSTTPSQGATGYTWFTPAGWTGTSTSTALTATAAVGGTVMVSATYTCGTSAPSVLIVTVNPAPVISIVTALPFNVCEGSTFTITPSGGTNYTVLPTMVSGPGPLVVPNSGITTYTLIGQNMYNCLALNNPVTVINSQITPTVSVNSGSVCQGQSFTMLPTGADSYITSSGFLTVTPNTPGIFNYTVTGVGTGGNSCLSIVPAISSLTVNANPSVSVTAAKPVVCKNESVNLTASGASTYSWNTGQTTAVVAVSPTVLTTYTVTGTTAEGCSRSKTIIIIVSDCVGINEIGNTASNISVYPNPAGGVFNVKFNSDLPAREIEIYNTVGQLINKQKAEAQLVEVDITNQPDGIYYIKLSGSNDVVMKIVKE